MAVGRRLGSGILAALKSRDAIYRLVPVCDDYCRTISCWGDSGRRWNSTRGELKGNVADVSIIGGGIVGLATAREIVQRFPKATVCLVEKESHLVEHQTSHNRYSFNALLRISHQFLSISISTGPLTASASY